MISKEKGILSYVAELAGFLFVKPLTVVQSIDLQYLLRIPTTTLNCMRKVFLDLDYVRVFFSKLENKQLPSSTVSHFYEAELSVESKILRALRSDKKMIHAPKFIFSTVAPGVTTSAYDVKTYLLILVITCRKFYTLFIMMP